MTILGTDEPKPASPPIALRRPRAQSAPLVFSSPHSGRNYPPEFLAASCLDGETLRRSEDSFVEELFGAAPAFGAPLLHARFPRAYLDPNREPWELDPAMFADTLPPFANTASTRVREGFGTIPRLITGGTEIYRERLPFAAAEERVRTLYRPYHRTLAGLLAETRARFGFAILIDCHSMPSFEWIPGRPWSGRRPDIVLGDRFGRSCAPEVLEAVETVLKREGFAVERNAPFAGGFITAHYGRPEAGIHALQIEINRALYMDEPALEKHDGFAGLSQALARLIADLAQAAPLRRAA